jgi:Uncharacterized protein conserved in bacteria
VARIAAVQKEKGSTHGQGFRAVSASIDHHELSSLLARAGIEANAAEFHGALCGALSVFAVERVDPWRLFPEEPPVVEEPIRSALDGLRDQALAALSDPQHGFTPLLPADDAALGERAQALADWCEGYLFGLAQRPGFDPQAGSEEIAEVLRDLGEFTRAALADEESEVEESAYVELVEYVRIGVQMVFIELMDLRAAEVPERRLH